MRPIKGIWCTETDLYICGTKVELTVGQHLTFCHIATNPERVFTRKELDDIRIGQAYDHSRRSLRCVDSMIKRIKQRIREETGYTQLIINVYGIGYQIRRDWYIYELEARKAGR